MTCRSSLFCSRSFCAFRKALEHGFVCHKTLAGIGLCYHVVTELKREQAQFLVDLFQTFFLVLRQVSSIVRKMLVSLGYQTHLFRVKTQLITLVVNEFNALEEFFIQNDSIRKFAQHRAYGFSDLIHLVITVRLQDVEEHTRHTVQQQTGSIQRDDGILERRFGFVVDNYFYLRFVLANCLFKSREVMLDLHFVEGRYAKGSSRLFQQGVGVVTC